jgi:hypothetical protein
VALDLLDVNADSIAASTFSYAMGLADLVEAANVTAQRAAVASASADRIAPLLAR